MIACYANLAKYSREELERMALGDAPEECMVVAAQMILAAAQGIEPRSPGSEPGALPLC